MNMNNKSPPLSIGVLTSGGDAQGMNAAVRAVVRTALHQGAVVYAIYEGYQGMVDGGERIRPQFWDDVGSILHRGGTIIGTARCAAFRERAGRLRAAHNLLQHGIDRLVIIGGDGSLSGADTFRREWLGLVAELVQTGQIDEQTACQHPALMIAGLVGSIDNDMVGTDMTIGADSALYRITEAIDAIASTAASHQRSFVVEVMGRHCGYLALMSAIAGGADYVLIPENPPPNGWEEQMCGLLRNGRAAGRRDSIVVVAEGAQDRAGNPISCDYVRQVLEERLGEDARVTILGHVQRGGTPSSFDRWMSTLLGHAAVQEVLSATPESEPQLIGIRCNRIQRVPLMQCVEQTRAVAQKIAEQEYSTAMELRGGSFTEMFEVFRAIAEASPSVTTPSQPRRLAIIHAGGLAPGMNSAVRAAVRFGLDRGHTLLGVRGSFEGLLAGRIEELTWGDVEGWAGLGGCELGTNRHIPGIEELYAVARAIETHRIEGLLIIGGWMAYKAAYQLHSERDRYPAFKIPMICLPATIDNNLPGSELSVGADSALNAIVTALDRVKQSAMAAKRCFVVETMGRYCGYLALMSGLAGGAERVYLHEEGVTLKDLQAEVERMVKAFHAGRRLYLTIRNERANPQYTTDFMCALFEEEGRGLFDVRRSVLGHFQQGGNPSPYDRILGTRLAAHCINFLSGQLASGSADGAFIGLVEGKVTLFPLGRMSEMVDWIHFRPKEQWWLELRPVVRAMAQSTLQDREN
ncbi:MAG: 6-phosphofructokinase [Candidatus Accumulibacter phosphatis]|uniref:6-phosphofructokinase n=1 Tax=Candidatus Accumulibacter phosphatis TaxID=327160 RepID=A0A080M237_9PROT|nr:6-phosphofructokinase [Accumulibacter sp.]KFB71214.1 MAG: 6-phosphofructokinase [Candidatus Accumulibacter phosphatis]MBL8408907.1 6-phosphofructokinase [Accumulibacter sp.]HRF12595.1 6-phosphofructokinase [Candidatus Accumulibacter phosphatis]